MDARFMIFVLSVAGMVATASGLLAEDLHIRSQGWINKLDDMQSCLNQENVTEADMKEFIVDKKSQDENEPLKLSILCFLKKINFFDGVSWNTEVIAESEGDNPKLLKLINDCLAKDDFTLSPQERSYQAQKCVLETGALN